MFRTFAATWSLAWVFLHQGSALSQMEAPQKLDWDGANLFSPEAKRAAEKKMRAIETKFGTRLGFETVDKAPVQGNDAATVNRSLDTWALDRFRARGQRGVYVVIVKDPPKIRVVHSNALENKKIFDGQDARELQKLLQSRLSATDGIARDRALLSATDFVFDKLQHSFGATTSPNVAEDRVNWTTWALIGVGLVIVIWFLIAVVRGFSSMGASPAGTSGGFFSSFLAGLFGAAAGMWLYNSFFGGPSAHAASGAADANESSSVTGSDWGAENQSTDSGGRGVAGGDWGGDTTHDSGDWAGGGDWGGGDLGGGDW